MDMFAMILAYLLVNTWITLALVVIYQISIEDYKDLSCLFVMSIASPWVFLLIRWVRKLFKKLYKRG